MTQKFELQENVRSALSEISLYRSAPQEQTVVNFPSNLIKNLHTFLKMYEHVHSYRQHCVAL